MLPASPNDGSDVSRGAIAALIEADDDNERFLACTVYARTGPLRDLGYVHAKVCIVAVRASVRAHWTNPSAVTTPRSS